VDEENLRESGGNSQAAWRSARAIASGRLVAGRPPAWTPPRRPLRRSPGARRPLRRGFNRMPEQQRPEVTTAWRSARAIASGRLVAGRPPAWTPPRRPPGARRPLRRGFNRMPEQQRPEVTPQPGVQRLKSPLEGFSPGVHLRGRCHGDRLCGRPARSALSGAVSTARLSSYEWRVEQRPEVTPQAAGRSAIEIASGRLFAGRPPAWTPPRRPHRRSPGAKRSVLSGAVSTARLSSNGRR